MIMRAKLYEHTLTVQYIRTNFLISLYSQFENNPLQCYYPLQLTNCCLQCEFMCSFSQSCLPCCPSQMWQRLCFMFATETGFCVCQLPTSLTASAKVIYRITLHMLSAENMTHSGWLIVSSSLVWLVSAPAVAERGCT